MALVIPPRRLVIGSRIPPSDEVVGDAEWIVVVGTSEGLVSVVVVPGVTVWEELDVEGISVGGTSEKLDGELVLVSEELDEVDGSEVCGNEL